jgi:hypothetical protein
MRPINELQSKVRQLQQLTVYECYFLLESN